MILRFGNGLFQSITFLYILIFPLPLRNRGGATSSVDQPPLVHNKFTFNFYFVDYCKYTVNYIISELTDASILLVHFLVYESVL